jgi:hypothetical protein
MKLTEQQLAEMFQHSKNTEVETPIDNLYGSMDASDKRLSDVETIADSSQLSASYHVLNQLQDWSQAVGNDIQLSLKPKLVSNFFAWLRPTVATAALVTVVYFVTPQVNDEVNYQQNNDQIMFSASFDEKADAINTLSFDQSEEVKLDVIAQSSFS